MARREDQAQEVVPDLVVDGGVEIRRRQLSPRFFLTELFVLLLGELLAAHEIDRAVLGRRHEPGAGFFGDARHGPLFERQKERVLSELLGEADVAHDPREPGDELWRFDSEERGRRSMYVGSHDSLSRGDPRIRSIGFRSSENLPHPSRGGPRGRPPCGR